MTSSISEILGSKRALRRELAALPVAEKLRMLDVMRERELAVQRNVFSTERQVPVASRRLR